MSYFTVAINEVLDAMKDATGITRQQFAMRIEMPLSTFSGYTKERTKPDAQALGLIASGLSEQDAARVIIAHLTDETPATWRDRVSVSADRDGARSVSLENFNFLPPRFRQQVEALLGAAKSNEHIISFIDEFVILLGLDTKAAPVLLWPSASQLPQQPARASGASITSPRGSSTLSLNEDPADAKGSKKTSGPRARSTRGIKKAAQTKKQ